MNTKEMIADTVSDFLESNHPSRWIRWIMVLFLLFCNFKDKVLRFEFETEEEFKKRKSFLFAG